MRVEVLQHAHMNNQYREASMFFEKRQSVISVACFLLLVVTNRHDTSIF